MTEDATTPARNIAPVGYAFMAVALVEAVTWTGLLVGMYQKYVMGLDDNLVPLFGRLHGLAFMLYVWVTFVASRALKWSARLTVVALVVAVPPLVTVPFELWMRRKGHLAPQVTTGRP